MINVSPFDMIETPAVLIELSRGNQATILVKKPNKGVNVSNDQISTLWIETLLKTTGGNQGFKLVFVGKFYKKGDFEGDDWTNDPEEVAAGDWPYYGWTITANEEQIGLGAFMLESTLLSCPSEKLRYNEFDDKTYRFVVIVV